MNPKVPLPISIDFINGYISKEDPEVQFQILANLLMRFLIEHVPPEEHQRALDQIAETIPLAAVVNMPTVGGVQ